jgi:outer membrane receptor protein involved in Fe transport
MEEVMKKLFIALFVTFSALIPKMIFAEERGSIYGLVSDKDNEEPLIGVNILVLGTTLGASTDNKGYYIIQNVPVGQQEIIIRMMGYQSETLNVEVLKNKAVSLNAILEEKVINLPGVVISGEKLVERSAVSDHALEGEALILREGHMQDPIRVMPTLPGITSTGGLFSSSHLYVRGGNPDENLFLLDWTPVDWPWHFGGMKSVFNSYVIEDVELQTGGFPAKYGNALSSVLNITTREGNREKFSGIASFGFINTQGLLEGPITSKGFFLFAARRSYIDLILKEGASFPVPYFWDGNFKLGYEPNPANKIYFSGLTSYESIDFVADDSQKGMPSKIYDEGKLNTQTLEWKSIINENLYSVCALTREKTVFQYEIGKNANSDIDALDYGFIEDLTWNINHSHTVKTGINLDLGLYDMKQDIPIDLVDFEAGPDDPTIQTTIYEVKDTTWSASYYIQDSWRLTDHISVTGGMRFDYWNINEIFDVSPRFSLEYKLTPKTELRAATGLFSQHPSVAVAEKEKTIDSKKARHYILGLKHKFNESLQGWMELYEKDYNDLITVDTLENFSNGGTGYARGIEFFLKKDSKKLNGWLSYSLGLSKRREFLDDVEYYADFDKRHMFSVVFDWKISKKYSLGAKFRYASGNPYTPTIAAVADSSGTFWIPIKGENNSRRYSPFHQLNIRLNSNYTLFGLKTLFYFEIWNVYNRKNVMGYYNEYGEEYENNVKVKPYYSLPILPAGGVEIRF